MAQEISFANRVCLNHAQKTRMRHMFLPVYKYSTRHALQIMSKKYFH